jgi:hypothetical protein
MKRNIVIFFFIYGYVAIAAQDYKVGISFLQNYSTFRYIDSEGTKSKLNYAIKFGYGLSFQKSLEEKIFLEGLILYNNTGAASSLGLDQLAWSFHYINADLNVGYEFNFWILHPQIGAGFYYGRLFKADQNVGSIHYDLMDLNDINKNDFGFNMFGRVEYKYSENGSLFLRINESMGLVQLEKGDSGQKMFNRTFSIQLGLLFPIHKNLP